MSRRLHFGSRILPKDLPFVLLSTYVETNNRYFSPEVKKLVESVRTYRSLKTQIQLEETISQCLRDCDDADSYRIHSQVAAFLKKYPLLSGTTPESRRQLAIEKNLDSNERCRQFNQRGWYELLRISETSPIFGDLVPIMRKFIANVLGSIHEADLYKYARHGPGSTITNKFRKSSRFFKWTTFPYLVNTRAKRYLVDAIIQDERWLRALTSLDVFYTSRGTIEDYVSSFIEASDFGRMTTVPKTAKVDRCIEIPNVGDVYLQLGIDGYIRNRLKRFSCDLNSQSRNQELARQGSIDGCYSTIDLEAASDSISFNLLGLFPKEWGELLRDLRTTHTSVDEELVEVHRLSAMGNGYTFVVETLIFLAACDAACKIFNRIERLKTNTRFSVHDCSVYGDDIIVPTEVGPYVINILNYLGFSVNSEKTFLEGPFRESCGADWFHGIPVRPLYFKQEYTTVRDAWFLYNSMLLKDLEFYSILGVDFKGCTDVLAKYIRKLGSFPIPLPEVSKTGELRSGYISSEPGSPCVDGMYTVSRVLDFPRTVNRTWKTSAFGRKVKLDSTEGPLADFYMLEFLSSPDDFIPTMYDKAPAKGGGFIHCKGMNPNVKIRTTTTSTWPTVATI